ncbi:Cyclin-H [Caenorhabditis elegans]|uniref:Cyclin-H n=1 Tax=Caenorhabditis elegans TaxID=6239 RepID=A0A7R9SUM0_CAEEL|nr:Cyclin-H [Caenorhabditis elegans]CAD8118632.1 Cyclin-H [Caenorhabditis elegans]
MYATSTQKREWTYTPEKLAAMRLEINIKFRQKYESVMQPDELELFVTPEEELRMQRSIEDAALKFADKFRPHIWPSVKWTALAFFKRAFLVWVPSDTSIRMVMMACFYLAMKIDEFYITIEDFVKNMKSYSVGEPRQNAERILKLEPELMKILDYNLTVHCPYRPYEGHLMDMKTRMLLLNFDLESIRRDSMRFFQNALQTDVLLLYPPSQIALAAINFGLHAQGKSDEILREFLRKLIGIEEDSWAHRDARPEDLEKLEKTVTRVNQIMREVDRNFVAVTEQERENHKSQLARIQALIPALDERRKEQWLAGGGVGLMPGELAEQPVDSDDEIN